MSVLLCTIAYPNRMCSVQNISKSRKSICRWNSHLEKVNYGIYLTVVMTPLQLTNTRLSIKDKTKKRLYET